MAELEIFLRVIWGMAPLWLPSCLAGVTWGAYNWRRDRKRKHARTVVR